MSHYDQNQPQVAYPYPPSEGAAYPQHVAPPPAGYPMKDGDAQNIPPPPPGQTQSRGDGFWKGCCAALCCCCVLDACF